LPGPFLCAEPFLKGFAAAVLGGLNSLAGGYLTVAFKNTLAFLVIIVIL
jgi:branched-subunit amino acid ABC-type transport system permease component